MKKTTRSAHSEPVFICLFFPLHPAFYNNVCSCVYIRFFFNKLHVCVRITVPIRLRYAWNACACILYTHIHYIYICIYTCVLERIYTYMSVQQFLERDKCSLFYTHTDTHSRVISIVALHHRAGINYSSIYIYV